MSMVKKVYQVMIGNVRKAERGTQAESNCQASAHFSGRPIIITIIITA